MFQNLSPGFKLSDRTEKKKKIVELIEEHTVHYFKKIGIILEKNGTKSHDLHSKMYVCLAILYIRAGGVYFVGNKYSVADFVLLNILEAFKDDDLFPRGTVGSLPFIA